MLWDQHIALEASQGTQDFPHAAMDGYIEDKPAHRNDNAPLKQK